MKKLACLLCLMPCLLLLGQTETPDPSPAFLPLPADLTPLNSKQGRAILFESSSDAFWSLIQYYVTQPDLGSCGVASCTMVLNALSIPRPVSAAHGEFRLFTPANFFTPAVSAIKPQAVISISGMSLDELNSILATFPVKTQQTHAVAGGTGSFRETVKASLRHPGEFMLVNYLRKALGQQSGGHISPVGAYSEKEDMILILDVSNYKYPWIWVKVEKLYHAMEVQDKDSETARGYVIVSRVMR